MLCQRVDFYLLDKKTHEQQVVNEFGNFLCRLVEKALQQVSQILLYCQNRPEALKFDNVLWNYKDESFIPHSIYNSQANFHAPVVLGYQNNYPPTGQLIINITSTVPDFFQQFSRLIEVIPADKTAKKMARIRYKQYQNAGIVPNILNI